MLKTVVKLYYIQSDIFTMSDWMFVKKHTGTFKYIVHRGGIYCSLLLQRIKHQQFRTVIADYYCFVYYLVYQRAGICAGFLSVQTT